MSSSRESSPDWLRSFKVPSPSHLTLSSDSGSLRDGKSRNDDKTDEEGSSPKSSQSLKVAGSKRKTPVSSEVESQTPSKRKKLDKKKAKEGNKEGEKTANESNIDKNIEHKVSIQSVWTLSSDSESFHDHSPKGEDHIDQVETSQPQLSDEEDSADGLVFGKYPSKKGSEEKSSKKQIDIDSHTPVKGNKIKGSEKGKRHKSRSGLYTPASFTPLPLLRSRVVVGKGESSSLLPLHASPHLHKH
ncbi:hypothetical protein DEO72_LG11g2438 [Vigna unguiculata]|uniref:Uncharacterized protein n=1 Tax=Vigna unguiculata TaxID=3917 RepID=A0A4D6NUG5_VIGUN|nr:hypothetical protein DEO72_LG11g2438 [Vigna unguiculata]